MVVVFAPEYAGKAALFSGAEGPGEKVRRLVGGQGVRLTMVNGWKHPDSQPLSRQLMGRVAVVAASDELYKEAEKFNSKVLVDKPLRIFRDAASALAWLTDAPTDRAKFAKSHSMRAEHENT